MPIKTRIDMLATGIKTRVGFIALASVNAEFGVVMLVYLGNAPDQ